MTLQQLEYVLALDRFRHFGKAAGHCGVTQPTLSSMIQKLEDELGAKIFDRNSQPVCPTPVGSRIIEQARKVLVQAEGIPGIVAEEKQSLAGTFTLGILPTIAPYLLPRFFPALAKLHPELDLRVAEMKTADIRRSLAQGEIDAGIAADVPGLEDLAHEALFYEPFYAYVSREDDLSAHASVKTSDLAGKQLWLLDEGHCFRDQLVRYCQLKGAKASQQTYRLGSMETFMRMVESGKGITFIPGLAVLQLAAEQRGLVRPFAVPVPVRGIVFLTRRDFIRHAVSRLLIQEIQRSVPGEMLSLRTAQTLV